MDGRAAGTGLMVGGAVAALAALLLAPMLGEGSDDIAVVRPIVMVSGLDDHGLLARETVDLLVEPALEGDEQVLATVADGTLVRVVGDDGGSWLEVVALDGLAAGWVDDFYVRGTAHVVGEDAACPTALRGEADGPVLARLRPSEQVELVDDHLVADGQWIGVRTLQSGLLGLVPAAHVSALPGPPPVAGVPCAEVVPDPAAQPHTHG